MRTRTSAHDPARHPWDRPARMPDHPAATPARWVVRLALLGFIAASLYPAMGLDAGVDVAVSCDPATVGVTTRCVATLTRSVSDTSSFPVRVGTYDNEQGNTPTEAEAIARARQFDVITAWGKQYKAHVAAMKAANPNLVLNTYVNGTHTWRTGLPESQYCHDATGAKVTTTGLWPGTYLMDPGNAGWRASLLNNVQAAIADSGFDGVFLDTLGRGALTYTVTGRCINPRTGAEYTIADWERSTSELARHIREQTGRHAVGNGASNGIVYFGSPPSSIVAQHLDGGLAEGFTRNGAFAAGSANETQILQDIAMLADGPVMNVLTKDWRTVAEGTKDQEMRYSFATFLLGTDGRDVFGWTGSKTEMTRFHPLWDVDLGTPQGASYALGSGRYRRDFARGFVIVDTEDRTGFIATETGNNILSATWSSSAPGAFEPMGCTVVDADTTTCEARYVPAPGSAGTHEIRAASVGGSGEVGTTSLFVRRRASVTSVVCMSPVAATDASTCTATVADANGGAVAAPTGTVTFSSVGGGSFSSSECSLVAISIARSTCEATYTPTVEGDHEISGAYGGDPDHRTSTSTPAVVTVEPTVVLDTAAPIVQISSPVDGTSIRKGRTITVVATATDDVGVTRVEFAADGVVMCSDVEITAMTCAWTVPRRGSTGFIVTVTAWDDAGNIGSQQISIKVATSRA
jgi:Hypothetical glycosyl hydrolase family 15/Bacterial Ig domain/Bacterial Ig-like domain (group 3)